MSSFTPVTIYYWPMFGRAGSTIRMLEHTGAPYEHISAMPALAGQLSAFGCSATDNFAPPLVVDGDERISQSTAVCMHIGNKVGLNVGITNPAKAVQHLSDIVDLFENGIREAREKGGAVLKTFIEGDRLSKLLGNMERSIKGPFYFGESPTYVDFYLCNHVDWWEYVLLDRLKTEQGVDILNAYEKIKAVVSGIRELASYIENKSGLEISAPNYRSKDEIYTEYK